MPLSEREVRTFLQRGFSRRQLGRIATLLTAGASMPFFSEFAMAGEAERHVKQAAGIHPANNSGLVRLNSNENPLGPCQEGLDALIGIAPFGGRFQPFEEQQDFVRAVAESECIRPDYVAPYAGSSDPLHRIACAFTSPSRSYCMASPGYGGGAPEFIGSRLVRVPLRPDYSHDAEAMIEAAPDAGVFFVCNPNNPTGTLTPREDIEYLVAHKPKDAIVVIDEAYIHFSGKAATAADLVAADKDVIVLRTFSKLYGMAGIRAGFAMGRPDLLAKLRPWGAVPVPVTSLACATASLRAAKTVVPERRAVNRRIRDNTFAWLEKRNIRYIAGEANFFMMDVKRPAQDFARAMAREKVLIGRSWPVWPTWVRVSVGTPAEMERFMTACERVYPA